ARSVSAEVARKVMRWPVAGLWMVSPVRIILASFGAVADTAQPDAEGAENHRPAGRFALAPRDDLSGLRVARLDEARLVREDDRLHAVAQLELHQQVRHMRLHRRLADEELLRDLRVREPARDQLQHL